MIKKDLIGVKLKEIEETLNVIKENLPDNYEDFLDLGLIKDGIYKKVEFCIQNVLDICATINSDLDLGIPGSDEEIILNLVRGKIISRKMGGKVKAMKGFRNFLVHRYGGIDDELAFRNIKEHLDDFYEFMGEMKNFLKNLKKGSCKK